MSAVVESAALVGPTACLTTVEQVVSEMVGAAWAMDHPVAAVAVAS